MACTVWAAVRDGLLACLRPDGDDPARVHPVQLWHSPYVSDTTPPHQPVGEAAGRVGNARPGRASRLPVHGPLRRRGPPPPPLVYTALTAGLHVRALDTHHGWGVHRMGRPAHADGADAGHRRPGAGRVETVRDITARAADALDGAADRIATVVRRLRGEAAPRAAAGSAD
ncbi:hypothetical protein GCM10023238_07120 [Streptomyces heliomycini]